MPPTSAFPFTQNFAYDQDSRRDPLKIPPRMLTIRIHRHIIPTPAHRRVDFRGAVARFAEEVAPRGSGGRVVEGDAFVVGACGVFD